MGGQTVLGDKNVFNLHKTDFKRVKTICQIIYVTFVYLPELSWDRVCFGSLTSRTNKSLLSAVGIVCDK